MNAYVSKPIREDLLFSKMIHVGIQKQKTAQDHAPEEKLVDLSMLEKTMRGNKKVIVETIDIFLEHFPENLEGMVEGAEQENFDLVRRNAHTMKSSVSLLGMSSIQRMLEEIERLASSGSDMPRIIELKNSLILLCRRAIAEIEKLKEQYQEQ